MAEPEVVYFNDPDKGRKRPRISNKNKRKLRQGDVTELFASSGPLVTSSNVTTATRTKTWSKSDLSTTIREISALADTVTRQMEAGKMETKTLLRGRQRHSVKSYPQIQKEKKEKELQKKEEQRISGTTIGKSGKQNDKRHVKGRGRWRDNIKALDPPVGKFKNGVLSLSQKEVKKISKS